MNNDKEETRGNGLIDPQRIEEPVKKQPKRISIHHDGLMEREENKVLTEDGRELLNEEG
jgi:hypothetical protein